MKRLFVTFALCAFFASGCAHRGLNAKIIGKWQAPQSAYVIEFFPSGDAQAVFPSGKESKKKYSFPDDTHITMDDAPISEISINGDTMTIKGGGESVVYKRVR